VHQKSIRSNTDEFHKKGEDVNEQNFFEKLKLKFVGETQEYNDCQIVQNVNRNVPIFSILESDIAFH